ncbi:hypothetical protein [Streptomyces xantholiticus]|uniref:hypothetical protein n=1 Tax=Streptomyces xantholiticus TaxID=68285 RepID=UPI001E38FAB5|nr:hypothetical protein [Streptomyces xantholiticus]
MPAEWRSEWPELDVSSSEVIARLLRAAQLLEDLFATRLRHAGDMPMICVPGRAISARISSAVRPPTQKKNEVAR